MAEVAVGKRIKISKIQQHMMLAALGTSLVFGVSLVFSIFFIKYISFNSKVIAKEDESISNYYKAIKNAGVCVPTNKDGKFSDKDLKACRPKDIDVASIPGTLRYNVLVNMTENNDLESVARDSQKNCYDNKGKKIDFNTQYEQAKSDEERAEKLYMVKMCSSLRVIPDALPASQNESALLSSVNQIFLLSGVQPESLAPNTSGEVSPIADIEVIPVAVSIEADVYKTTGLLQNLERSIRSFSFRTATITWKSSDEAGQEDKLELSAQALAFYTNEIKASEKTETVYASKDAKKSGGSGSSKTIDDVVEEKTGVKQK